LILLLIFYRKFNRFIPKQRKIYDKKNRNTRFFCVLAHTDRFFALSKT